MPSQDNKSGWSDIDDFLTSPTSPLVFLSGDDKRKVAAFIEKEISKAKQEAYTNGFEDAVNERPYKTNL